MAPINVSSGKTVKELVLSKLNHTPISFDLLSEDLRMPVNIINAEVAELELDGKIVIENGMIRIK